MNWSTLLTLYKSKALVRSIKLIILIAPLLGYIIYYGLELDNYRIALIGACLLIFSYLLIKLFAPETIKINQNVNRYIQQLMGNITTVNLIDEFSCLDSLPEHIMLKYNLSGYLPVKDGGRVLSKEQAINRYGSAKFLQTNSSKPIIRFIVILLFISGVLALYWKIFASVIKIIFKQSI